MSRFFTKYDSESSSEEEDLLSSEEEELLDSSQDEQNAQDDSDSDFFNDDSDSDSDSDSDAIPKGPAYFLKSSFLKGGKDSDDDSDEDDKRVVRSAKDKLFDDLKDAIDKLDTAKVINNWINALNEFDRMGRLLTRSNQQNFGTPNFYIVALSELEESVNEFGSSENQDRKKMAADQSRAFNTIRQRVKRQVKEFQSLVDYYHEKPELFEKDEPVEVPVAASSLRADDESATGFSSTNAQRNLSPVFQTLKAISESRGKKNIDKFEQIQTLESLLEETISSNKTFELISIYQMLISIRFDASSNQTFMPLTHWQKNLGHINSLITLLNDNKATYQVSEFGKPTDDIDIEPEVNEDGVKLILGSVGSLIERLDDEFTKILQNLDPHSTEYIERLKDESSIYKLILKGQLYIESTYASEQLKALDGSSQLTRIVSRRLDHIYYKPDQLIKSNEADAWSDIDGSVESVVVSKGSEPAKVVEGLSDFLSKNSVEVFGKKTLLSKIYYYAVNDHQDIANELFLSSKVYANIDKAESSLQIMYNRALVQLGLSAFRVGLIDVSHQALNEIANSQRPKELLGQGFNTKYPSQASVTEKQKLLPFHMHINLELLECVYMTSSLLIEIPALAQLSSSAKDNKRKLTSRSFKSKLDFYDRQYFTGPPESIKDHIIHAAKALQKGDWAKAYELLSSIKIWKLFSNNAELLAMMKNQLQVEGLRTYIFTYKSIYSKLSIDLLSTTFELNSEKVVSILAKMIDSNEIAATLDDNNKFINFVSSGPQRTKLQSLALIMNEKVGLLTEKNEKTAYHGRGRKQQQQQQPQNQQQNQQHNQTQDGAKDQKDQTPQPQQSQSSQSHYHNHRDQKDGGDEFANKFRIANVNSNNDEFQAMA